jgi:serine/threonine protein kinase
MLAYMSPEQDQQREHVDSRSDLYALGMTFYKWLTGQLPFKGRDAVEGLHNHVTRQPAPPSQLEDGIPVVLDDIVLRLIAKNADERYLSARALEQELERCLKQWEACGKLSFEPALPALTQSCDVLIGRKRERLKLQEVVRRAKQINHGECILVAGSSGAGKSTLIKHFAADFDPNEF